MKLDFHIALIILYVIDCTHFSEHDNDHYYTAKNKIVKITILLFSTVAWNSMCFNLVHRWCCNYMHDVTMT